MLLGIALHAALSFAEIPWVVQDRDRHSAFSLFFYAVHGFRMPVFFLMSGFFTAMLWRRRGLSGLIGQRLRRVVLPLAIGCVTIVPLVWVVIILAALSGPLVMDGAERSERDIWSAAAYGNLEALERHIDAGASVDAPEPFIGQSPLAWAAIGEQPAAVALLLESGADPNTRHRDGNTALHIAAFFGRAECVKLLLDAGADVGARNDHDEVPLDTLRHDRGTTEFIAGVLKVPIEFEEVAAGRKLVVAEIEARSPSTDPRAPDGGRRADTLSRLIKGLMTFPAFHHLWFLWFLCWLVAGFALVVRLPLPKLPRFLVTTGAAWLWLIPLTMLPQSAMHEGFGPDTSIGILPRPHVLLYYAIFFGFGALYYEARDDEGRMGRAWWAQLPLALLVIFPLGVAFSIRPEWTNELMGETLHRAITVFLEALYTWLMIFGLIGLFRRVLSGEHPRIRYLSDSSYWLYLAHLPLIVVAQALVRDWPLPAALKFTLVLGGVTGLLLVVYRYAVRYTTVGRLLNGPRARP